MTSVVQALCRLDTDVDVPSTLRQAAKTSFENGVRDETDELSSGEDLDGEDWRDTDELDNIHLSVQNDVGYDSAEEEHIWIWLGVLAQPF